MATEHKIPGVNGESAYEFTTNQLSFTKLTDLEVYIGKQQVEKVVLNNAGAGYTNITDAALEFSGGGGSNAALTVDVANGQVSLDNAGVPINKGTGYSTSPIVGFGNISGGTGASATAEIYAKKTLGTDYTISKKNETTVKLVFTPALVTNDEILIKRVTDTSKAVNIFNAGSAITAADLNKSFDQIRYRVEELPEVTSTAVTNGDKGDISVSGNSWTINDITTAKIVDSSITSAKIADDTIVNADVNSSAAVVSSKLSFTQSATGGTARTILTKLDELISVKDFGAVGNGSTDDTTAIKNAIAAGDGVNIVYFPAGTYIVKEPITIPSNSYIKGAGAASTSIKMDSSIGKLTGLGVIGDWDTTVENVLVEDITFDFNTARWHNYPASPSTSSNPRIEYNIHNGIFSTPKNGTYVINNNTVTVTLNNHGFEVGETIYVTYTSANSSPQPDNIPTGTNVNGAKIKVVAADGNSFEYDQDTTNNSGNCSVKVYVKTCNRNALTIFNSKYVTLNRVRCLHGQRHSLDITAPYRRKDSGDATSPNYYLTSTTYMHKGAQYITVNDCYFTGAGDDNLTTHFSSDILITNCLSELPRGGFSDGDTPNTNCFEIDDGSRNVQLYNNRAYKGNQGLEIKAHGYAPAPYNVIVDGLEVINCVGGVECHHSNWITQTTSSSTAWVANGGTNNTTVPDGSAAGKSDLRASYISKSGTYTRSNSTVTVTSANHGLVVGDTVNVKYTTAVDPAIGVPATFSSTTAGSGYDTSGTDSKTNVPTTGGTGTGLTVDVTVGSTVTAFEINNAGTGYKIGDVVTLNSAAKDWHHSSGTDATFTIGSTNEEKIITTVADSNTFTYTSGSSGTITGGSNACTITSNKLNSLSDDGYSATANNVSFNNIQIIAPCNRQFKTELANGSDGDAELSRPTRCFEISGYDGVQVNNLLISEGSKDRNLIADGYSTCSNLVSSKTDSVVNRMDGRVVHLRASNRNWSINNLTINGFYNKADIGIEIISNSNESFNINNLNIIDGPAQAIFSKGTDNKYLGTIDNYNIYQTFDPTASIAGTYGVNKSEGNKTYKDLDADQQYALRINPQSINLGKGTIKGYPSGEGIKPQKYTPLIYGSGETATGTIKSFTGIDDVKYTLNGNVCTVFMQQEDLTQASGEDAASGNLRIMLPFRPLEDGFPCAVFSNNINFNETYVTITAKVVAGEVYSDVTGTTAGAKFGYVTLKGVKDNATAGNIACTEISANTDIYFTMTYLIDLSADPNF